MSRISRSMLIVVCISVAVIGTAWAIMARSPATPLAARYHLRQRTTQFFQRAATPIPPGTPKHLEPTTTPAPSGAILNNEAKSPGTSQAVSNPARSA